MTETLRLGLMTTLIAIQKARNAADGLGQIVAIGQKDQAEVIRMRPVETAALHHQHFFFFQQLPVQV